MLAALLLLAAANPVLLRHAPLLKVITDNNMAGPGKRGQPVTGLPASPRVRLRSDAKWYSSNAGREAWAIERTGFIRTTIALPAATAASDVAELGFDCLGQGQCEVRQATKAFFPDAAYRPGESFFKRRLDWRLSPGEMMTWTLPSK